VWFFESLLTLCKSDDSLAKISNLKISGIVSCKTVLNIYIYIYEINHLLLVTSSWIQMLHHHVIVCCCLLVSREVN